MKVVVLVETLAKTMEIGRDTGDNSISGKDNEETDPYRFSNWALYNLSLGAFSHVNLTLKEV